MNIPDASLFLSAEEQKQLLTRNDIKGLLEVVKTWMGVFAIFTMIYFYPNIYTFIIGWLALGGRQLAVSVITHDTSHKSLFHSSWMNNFFGKWFGGYPLLNDMLRYRPYHVKHHVHTGLEEDPDTNLTRGYPSGKDGLMRKFFRDLSGITGIKTTIALFMMHLNYLEYEQGNNPKWIDQSKRSWGDFFKTLYHNTRGPILCNLILFAVVSLIFAPWVYAIWVISFFTSFQFCVRVRAIAEHSMVEHPADPYANTRTTYANVIERFLFAPHNVNYHVEHHMLMGVPCYNLPQMHQLIKKKGFFKKGQLASGYWEIIKMAALK